MKLFLIGLLTFGSISAFSAEICELSKVAQTYEKYTVLPINCSSKYPSLTYTLWTSEGALYVIHKKHRFDVIKELYKAGFEEVVTSNDNVERFIKR